MRRWFYAGLAVAALAEIATPYIFEGKAHFAFEHWPSWGSVYGLMSCVIIIVVSKIVGHLWLMRPENYYDKAGKKS